MSEPRERLHPANEKQVGEYAAVLHQYREDVFVFIRDMWSLIPQPVKPEYKRDWEEVCRAQGETWLELKDTVTAEWFGDMVGEDEFGVQIWEWHEFEKGKHITWQQVLILMGVNKARDPRVPSMISIVSGHGIGKSATCAWIVLWYLYCFIRCQVPVTAPTASQMHDVLWKEMNLWIGRMPEKVQPLYEWTAGYIRITYDPETWFARARTSTKENTEAIAGVHADKVAIVVDEASGVPEQVYDAAEGALTSGDVLVILISNGTRTIGYFYDSHNKNKALFQTFRFDGEQTPMVDKKYVALKLKRNGRTSEEFRVRVSGGFPKEDAMDDGGYMQLIPRQRITVIPRLPDNRIPWIGRTRLSCDPSGEGKDEATIAAGDAFKCAIVDTMNTTNENQIAERLLTWAARLGIKPEDMIIDGFGVGTRIAQKIVLASKGMYNPYTALVGNPPKTEEKIQPLYFTRMDEEMEQAREDEDEAWQEVDTEKGIPADLYVNIRALMYFRLRKQFLAGYQLVDNDTENSESVEELMGIRYKRSLQGNKIQMMTKKEMKKLGIKSPNKADALALLTLRHDTMSAQTPEEVKAILQQESEYDPHDIL